MRRLRLGLVGGCSVLSALAAIAWANPSRAGDPDRWFGPDKALHFGAAATIAVTGYGAGAAIFESRGYAVLLGAGAATLASVGKETLDLTGYGDPSWKDLAWDGVGTFVGLLVAWSVDCLIRGVSSRHPAFDGPLAPTQPPLSSRAGPASADRW